jgi:hypothetical protein
VLPGKYLRILCRKEQFEGRLIERRHYIGEPGQGIRGVRNGNRDLTHE